MSRAFVKEQDGAEEELPERPLSPHPNYVTPRGLARLRERVQALEQTRRELAADEALAAQQQRREVERDLRYFGQRLAQAQVVPRDPAPRQVRIGTRVEVLDEDGAAACYAIVGEDEADAAAGLVSWVSPLARALLGAGVGDRVRWERPDGTRELEVRAILPLPEGAG